MKNPIACRAPIEPYMPMTRRRSAGVIVVKDCRTMAPSRGLRAVVEADTHSPLAIVVPAGLRNHPHGSPDAHYLQVRYMRSTGPLAPAGGPYSDRRPAGLGPSGPEAFGLRSAAQGL